MHAAIMNDGTRPVYGSFPEPEASAGSVVVAVRAAALTGFDRAVARRLHYFQMPDGPFVLGKEGVARRDDGQRIRALPIPAVKPECGLEFPHHLSEKA